MNVLSLFSGIGGLDLGLERAGMTVVGQVEIDPWCRQVLAKHWPEVPRHDDVRTAAGWWLGTADVADAEGGGSRSPGPREDQTGAATAPCGSGPAAMAAADASSARGRPAVDLVAGGFPCQPVSLAGKGLAQADSRWLWPAFADVIRGLRPRFVLVENVPGLLGRGMGDVLGDLAALGYDADWDRVSAAAVGAPHLRERIWIVAHSPSAGPQNGTAAPGGRPRASRRLEPERLGGHVADAEGQRRELRQAPGERPGRPASSGPALAYARSERRGQGPRIFSRMGPERCGWWVTEPDVGRVAHGIPRRVDRLRGLGNAVVPQVAEHIGRLIMDALSVSGGAR